MALENEAAELKRLEKQRIRLKPRHDRMEEAYRHWNLSPFKMPLVEGKWDSVTSNSPAVLANGIADRLAGAKRHIWLPVTDEVRKEREAITATERFVNAALTLNDERLARIPEMTSLQAALAWDATVCGFVIPRVWLHEDDTEGGKFTVLIDAWDPRHVYWISGPKGSIWVCYERKTSLEDLKATYGSDVKATADTAGEVLVRDIFDREEEGIIADETYVSKEKHKLNHIPVMVLPVGTARYVRRELTSDTMKDFGADCFINNLGLYESRNRTRSYRTTLVGRAARKGQILLWDSTKGGRAPKVLHTDPGEKGALTILDSGKGQDLKEFDTPEMTRDASILDQEIDAELSVGGMAPIAYGQINQQLPYGGISLLTDSAMQRLIPAKLAVEAALEFVATEAISQFKTGGFEEQTLKGVDGSNRAYTVKVSKDDIDDEWRPKCELHTRLPKDEQIQIAVATQEVTSGLLSKRESREKHQLSDDLDLTESLIDGERVDEIGGVVLRKVVRQLEEDDPEGNAPLIAEIMGAIEQRSAAATEERGVPIQPDIPIPANPMAGFASRTAAPGRSGTRVLR